MNIVNIFVYRWRCVAFHIYLFIYLGIDQRYRNSVIMLNTSKAHPNSGDLCQNRLHPRI